MLLPLPPRKYRRLSYQLNEDKAIPDINLSGFESIDGYTPALRDAPHLGRIIAVSACQAVALLERSHAAAPDRDLPLEQAYVYDNTIYGTGEGIVFGSAASLPANRR